MFGNKGEFILRGARQDGVAQQTVHRSRNEGRKGAHDRFGARIAVPAAKQNQR